jgi:hypothetical protein
VLRIHIKVMRIRILALLVTLMRKRIRILPFTLMRIRIRILPASYREIILWLMLGIKPGWKIPASVIKGVKHFSIFFGVSYQNREHISSDPFLMAG